MLCHLQAKPWQPKNSQKRDRSSAFPQAAPGEDCHRVEEQEVGQPHICDLRGAPRGDRWQAAEGKGAGASPAAEEAADHG